MVKFKPCMYVGAETGLLKAVDLGLRTATNYYGPDELDAAQSIETMTLLEERAILVGMKNGAAKVFDSEARSFKQPVGLFSDDEFGKWTGLHSVGEQLVGTSETGVIRTWSKEQFSKRSEMVNINFYMSPWRIIAGALLRLYSEAQLRLPIFSAVSARCQFII